MTIATTLIFLLFIALLSAGLTWGFVQFANKANFLDVPNHRSSHERPVPRGGGIAFVISFYIGIGIIYAVDKLEFTPLLGLFLGGAWVALAGGWDDIEGLAIPWRLCFQGIGIGLCLVLLGMFFPVSAFDGWSVPIILLSFVGWLWLVNLYNFMDGIDGLATSEAIVVALGAVVQLLFFESERALILPFLVLIAALLGFYFFNRTPARVFMGDIGSCFLGFILGGFGLMTLLAGVLTVYSWLILLAVFWVDATFTLLRRMITKQAWYRPHCTHGYQRLVKRGNRHLQVTSWLMWINIAWLWPLSTLSLIYPNYAQLLLGIAVIPLGLYCFWVRAGANDSRPS